MDEKSVHCIQAFEEFWWILECVCVLVLSPDFFIVSPSTLFSKCCCCCCCFFRIYLASSSYTARCTCIFLSLLSHAILETGYETICRDLLSLVLALYRVRHPSNHTGVTFNQIITEHIENVYRAYTEWEREKLRHEYRVIKDKPHQQFYHFTGERMEVGNRLALLKIFAWHANDETKRVQLNADEQIRQRRSKEWINEWNEGRGKKIALRNSYVSVQIFQPIKKERERWGAGVESKR